MASSSKPDSNTQARPVTQSLRRHKPECVHHRGHLEITNGRPKCNIFAHLARIELGVDEHEDGLGEIQPLLDAVCLKDLDQVKTIMAEMKIKRQRVPLQTMAEAAVERADTPMLEYLFGEGAILTRELDLLTHGPGPWDNAFFQLLLRNGWPAVEEWQLFSHIRHRDAETLETLLSRAAITDNDLHMAAQIGDLAKMKLLLERYVPKHRRTGDQPFKRVIDQECLLHCAAMSQKLDMLRYLIAEGADANLTPPRDIAFDERECVNGTPLHKALFFADQADVDVVRALVEAGADSEKKDERGLTAARMNWCRDKAKQSAIAAVFEKARAGVGRNL